MKGPESTLSILLISTNKLPNYPLSDAFREILQSFRKSPTFDGTEGLIKLST